MTRDRRVLYGGFILLECVLWGLGNPIIKIAGELMPPFASITLRFSIAFIVFALFFSKRVWRGLRCAPFVPCLLICVLTALAFTLGTFALMRTRATTAGFLMGIAVLFTPFLEPLLLRTKFDWRVLPLVTVVCAGMYLLCGAGSDFVFGLGEAMAVLCSLTFAAMLTLSEKYVAAIDPIALSAMQCLVAAIFAGVCMLCIEGPYDIRTISGEGIAAILYLAIGSTCVAYVLQNKAMRRIPATFASIAFSTEPIFTALFSFLLLGETLPPEGYVGAAIVMAGVFAASAIKR